ncbi:peptidase domain-containing ABC transporter [Acidocella aminolytica]|nr:peptidase domain-containing ABC transporter [Acidocella aminolytica]SHE37814.1 ABC-type bacteriocin/lantibiotic exporter, contains an N-terminal double-glycine peptidase domain [Acidocella aminolytica 101 = DSM 11237]
MNDSPHPPESGPEDMRETASPDVAVLHDAHLHLNPPDEARLAAILNVARYHGIEMDIEALKLRSGDPAPNPPELVQWLREAGLWARGVNMNFRQLMKVNTPDPIILLLEDGGAALVVGRDLSRQVLVLRDPRKPASAVPVLVDELRLKQVWNGATLLIRASRKGAIEEQPFSLGLISRLVWSDRKILRDIAITSVTLTILSLVPILVVMRTIGQVLQYHGTATLNLIILLLSVSIIFEAILTWSRKMMEVILATKLDARLNLMVFDRLVSLPIDYFEREQSGKVAYQIAQTNLIREFLTGKLMNAFIDVFMLIFLLPILFYMSATLAWTVLIAAALIAAIIAVFLRPMAIMTGRIIEAESSKSSVLIETIFGIRTVKALALENTRAAQWDTRVAEVADLKVAQSRLANWPTTLALPLQRYCMYGVIVLGAYIALHSQNPTEGSTLFGFMLLSGRVAGPLISLAGLLEEVDKTRAAVLMVGQVLNRSNERHALTNGLRPRFEGSIEFNDVTFRYEGSKTPALDKMSFKIPAGTMLGLVGRSGSGKSTVTRLLQGINRDYTGAIRIDGTDMREINLRHIRKNFGMVLQDNFLFRGSVRDNIIAGRPGLSFEDAVRAARLAGAEEFIERLPNGYDTFIQEGSPNLSGGQKQRLAIARALISDPKILILDEATSALDPESEALVNANIKRIAAGRTMVIVSHRLSSLLDCNLIMVLDRGQTIDIGTHYELVERCAIYRHLWFQQNRHLAPEGFDDAEAQQAIT